MAAPSKAQQRREPTPVDLAALLPSWEPSLRAERKSPATLNAYGDGVRWFLACCAAEGMTPVLDRASVNAFVADLLEAGAEPATARSRPLALRRFSAWLAEEGETDGDGLLGIRGVTPDSKVVDPLDDGEVQCLLAACAGPTMLDRRDPQPGAGGVVSRDLAVGRCPRDGDRLARLFVRDGQVVLWVQHVITKESDAERRLIEQGLDEANRLLMASKEVTPAGELYAGDPSVRPEWADIVPCVRTCRTCRVSYTTTPTSMMGDLFDAAAAGHADVPMCRRT